MPNHPRRVRHAPVVANSLALIANTVLSSAFGLLFWLVVARQTTPQEFGLASTLVSSITVVVVIADLGLGTTVVAFAGAHTPQALRIANTAASVSAALALALGALVVVVGPVINPEFVLLHSPQLAIGYVATAGALSLSLMIDKLFVASELSHRLLLRTAVSGLIRVGIVLLSRLGVIGVVAAFGLGAFVGVGLMVRAAIRAIPGYRPEISLKPSSLQGHWRYSLIAFISSASVVVPAPLYPVLVGWLLGPRANADFYILWMVYNLLLIIPSATATAAFARASRARMEIPSILGRGFALSATLTSISSAGLLASLPVVHALFGLPVPTGGPLVLVLVLAIIPYSVTTYVITFHRLRNRLVLTAILSLVSTAASAVLSGLAASSGIEGIGAGWLGGQALASILALATLVIHRHPDGASISGAVLSRG